MAPADTGYMDAADQFFLAVLVAVFLLIAIGLVIAVAL